MATGFVASDVKRARSAIGFLAAVVVAAALAGTVEALVPSDPQASHPTYAAQNLPAAWNVTTRSPRVVIAIVDTGIDPTHPDLARAVIGLGAEQGDRRRSLEHLGSNRGAEMRTKDVVLFKRPSRAFMVTTRVRV